MPIQQAAIAEASGANIGRSMGIYESASLIGALLGTAVAGAVYDRANWVGVTGGMINLGGMEFHLPCAGQLSMLPLQPFRRLTPTARPLLSAERVS